MDLADVTGARGIHRHRDRGGIDYMGDNISYRQVAGEQEEWPEMRYKLEFLAESSQGGLLV